MKTKLFITAILFATVFIACNHGANKKEADQAITFSDVQSPEFQKTGSKEKKQIPVGKFSPIPTDSTGTPIQTPLASNPDWDSKIIKTATLRLEIKDFRKYNDYVHNAVKQYGAYVAQEDQNLSDEKSETNIIIKVPVAQFEPMMNKLPLDDSKVMEKKISTEDVDRKSVV